MSMRTVRAIGSTAFLMSAFGLWAAACGSDSLVGGSCRSGLVECSLQCVDIASDPANCGACGRACTGAQACVAGTCTFEGGVPSEAGEPDASVDDIDASLDGSPDASFADVLRGDAIGRGDAPIPDDAGPLCPAPYNTPEHCGTCETQCSGDTSLCGLTQGEYKCIAQCELPLQACGPLCVDVFSDENHCGGCFNVCPSGICQAGVCVGKGFGHQIVIGMDYADDGLSQNSAQVTLLANAVLVPSRSAVRVLVYDEYADPATKSRLESWIGAAAVGRGRAVTFQSAGAWSTIPRQLTVANYDAFLVYDQATAPSTTAANMGTLWNGAMEAYAKGGGVIVALDGGSPARMIDLINNGGLFTVLDEVDVDTQQLKVDAPTDVVGLNLPDVFIARSRSVGFVTRQIPDNRRVFVVKADGDLPVVVHSVP